MRPTIWKGIGGIFSTVVFASILTAAPPRYNDQSHGPAVPGTVNYIEGQATMNGAPLNRDAAGSMQLQPGQGIMTQNGRVEVLLTPGVFVRVGSNSSLQMVS